MKFYGRAQEIEFLLKTRDLSRSAARMTILKGRRRVGKTSLLRQAYGGEDFLYFFVAKKSEADLCLDFQAEISRFFGMTLPGTTTSFEAIFRFLMEMSTQRHFTLVIDEFQEFMRINPSIFSSMQRDWDLRKGKSCMNLVVCGSINKMMEQIFGADQPLYGRATGELRLDPFSISALKEILADHVPTYDPETLLALWTLTGGVAKYVELLMDEGASDLSAMVKGFISDGSTIPNEGKVLLVDEFRKDYGTYFSILSLIASGRTGRGEIQDIIGSDVGGYLTKLCDEYRILSRKVPFGGETARNMLYEIDDNFLRFWFRFVWKYQAAIELKAYDRLRDLVLRDYRVFSGKALEGYFRRRLAEEGCWTRIGGWWDRRGENEIDIIALDEFEKRILFGEVKRNAEKIDLDILQDKAESFLRAAGKYGAYRREYRAFSLAEM